MKIRLAIVLLLSVVSPLVYARDSDRTHFVRLQEFVGARPADFTLEVFFIPDDVLLSAPASEVHLEANYCYKLSLSGKFIEIETLGIFNLLASLQAKDAGAQRGDYRRGLLLLGLKGERLVFIGFDREAQLLSVDRKVYRADKAVVSWFDKNIDSLFNSSAFGKLRR